MPDEKDIQLLAFDEDSFDLEEHKKITRAQTCQNIHVQRTRRQLSWYRIFIVLLAFVAAYWLYNMATVWIQQQDYNKYHSTTEY